MMDQTISDGKSIIITRGPIEAPIAVEVYGVTSSKDPLWVQLRFDPGKNRSGRAVETPLELATRVYASDAPFDLAFRERYVLKAAGAIARTIEADANQHVKKYDATAAELVQEVDSMADFGSLPRLIKDKKLLEYFANPTENKLNNSQAKHDAWKARLFHYFTVQEDSRERFASYLLRSKLEQHLDEINFADSWERLSATRILPLVTEAIAQSQDNKAYQVFCQQCLYEPSRTIHWSLGFSIQSTAPDLIASCLSAIKSDVSMYGLEAGSKQAVWFARFSLTTVPNNIELWARFLQSDKERYSVLGEGSDTEDIDEVSSKDGATKTSTSINSEFSVKIFNSSDKQTREAIDDTTRREVFGLSQVYNDSKFEHGIIFVHGIGPHKPRETLTKFGEPFLKFWSDLLSAATGLAKQRAIGVNAGCSYHQFRHNARFSSLLNREDHNGILRTVYAFEGKEKTASPKHGFVCGTMRVKDTVLDQGDDSLPACSLVQLTGLYSDCSVRESSVMLAESHWTDKVISYSFDELESWLFTAFPMVVASQFNLHHRAAQTELLMYEFAIFNFLKGSKDLKGLSGIKASIALLFKKGLLWVATRLTAFFHYLMMPIVLIALMVLQPALYILLLLRLIPISPLQSLVNKVVSILAGTVGQSQVLIQSPIRRNAIVSVVSRDILKLLDYCTTVSVVAHSQGAEVVRMVASTRGWDRVLRWVTFGPGITPLNNLRQDFHELSDDEYRTDAKSKFQKSKSAKYIRGLFLGSAAPLVLFVLSFYFDGVFEQIRWYMAGTFVMLIIVTLIPALRLSAKIREEPPEAVSSLTEMGKTHNYYASHDPVPDGPVIATNKIEELRQRGCYYRESEIHNRHSIFQDHTSYLQNIEQFVAPVGLESAYFADFLPALERHHRLECKRESVKQCQRRQWLSWIKSCATFYFYTLILFWLGYLHFFRNQFSVWAEAFEATFHASTGFWHTTAAVLVGPLKVALQDLFLLFILIAVFYYFRQKLYNNAIKKNQKELLKNLADEIVIDGFPGK